MKITSMDAKQQHQQQQQHQQHLTTDTDDTSSDLGGTRTPFRFPPAPRLCKSANSTTTSRSVSYSYNSDSSVSDGVLLRTRRRNRRRYSKPLPPIGVFWDIENCQVPKNKSASSIVQKIRELFFDGYREAEFIVVCDVKKENAQIIQDLHDAQVNLIHVSSTSKNAADEKLRQSLRRYADTHSAPSAVVLISGDINFAGDLSDLRYRKKIQVILIHNSNATDALISCANKSYAYGSLTENLPLLKTKISSQYEILIANLPINCGMKKLRNRLNRLSDNCGGKVINVDINLGTAVLVFSNYNFAIRAQRRLRGEDVFGSKIRLSNPTNVSDLPARKFSARPPKSVEGAGQSSGYCSQDGSGYYPNTQKTGRDLWKYSQEQDAAKALPYTPQDNYFVPIRSLNVTNTNQQQRSFTPMDDSSGACGVSYSNRSRPSSTFTSEDDDNQTIKPVQLFISNLDAAVNLKVALRSLLKEHVRVLSFTIMNSNEVPIAKVEVASQLEAQYLISQLHHYRLGNRRIFISYVQNNSIDRVYLRDMVISILMDVPENQLPLYYVIAILDGKFNIKASISEMHSLRDIVHIKLINGERIISLRPEISTSFELDMKLLPYCTIHRTSSTNQDWYETLTLPNLNVPLQTFSKKLHDLLIYHMNFLPLLSIPICYQSVFGELLPEDKNGVPLEHLVTCVKGVTLSFDGPKRNIKYIKRSLQINESSTGDNNNDDLTGIEPMLRTMNANFRTLSHEVFQLLRATKNYQLPLSKFIPTYYSHYRRQCRLADYGFVKLIDLLQCPALAKVIKVIGDGSNRIITLTHSSQVRRFTSDLLKVIKSQPRKSITLDIFPSAYERTKNRPFNPFEYGLCQLEDLLNEVPKSVVVISKENPDEPVTISIPNTKRIHTAEEIVRTNQFADRVIELLYQMPQYSIIISRFMAAYNRYFGSQCRLSDYGFTRLIDLFEAIPETVRLEDLPNGECKICLTTTITLKFLGLKIRDLIEKSELGNLPLSELQSTYFKQYRSTIHPQSYGCESVLDVISKLMDYIDITLSDAGPLLTNVSDVTIIMRIWGLLLQPPHILTVNELIKFYEEKYRSHTALSRLESLKDVVIIRKDGNDAGDNSKTVQLTPLYMLAAEIYHLLYRSDGKLRFGYLETRYEQTYHKSIRCHAFDANGLEDLIGKMNFAFVIQWPAGRTHIALKPELNDYGIPVCAPREAIDETTESPENLTWPPPPQLPLWERRTNRSEPLKLDKITPNIFSDSMQQHDFTTSKLATAWKQSGSSIGNSQSNYRTISGIPSPHPTEVPMPNKLLGKDDSNDSGVVNSKSETESSTEREKRTGTKPKILSSGKKQQLKFDKKK